MSESSVASPLKPIPVSPLPNLKTRRFTLFSFWAIFLLLGVPLWWATTTLERRQLPKERIERYHSLARTGGKHHSTIDGRVVKYSRHYKLVFSLLNQNSTSPNEPLLSWGTQGVDQLLNHHFKPLLSSLKPLHNFTIESQVQYYAPLSVNLQRDTESTWVEEDDVKAFVNNAEWNLASGTTLDPVLHFILYVPSKENRPMTIRTSHDATTTSFITPQRGGLVIYNPPTSSQPASLENAFRTFSQQLRLLLGLPPLTSESLRIRTDRNAEIENLISIRLGESRHDTISTLSTLLKSIDPHTDDDEQVKNEVSVNEVVKNRVESALDLLDTAQACALSPTCDPSMQLSFVSLAQHVSNLAYFDPTLLPLLYFPQEHKYAVYTPLFGPVSVPLVMGLVREFKEWRDRRRKRRLAEKENDASSLREKTE